ncbi:MAG: hypothetical protein IJ421_09975 [Prevotella sp.]|nr:hypothetical protein [Prevotella sp.]
METALQRIMRKTGRKPIECKCQKCKQQCKTPCLGTPEDILRLINAGYKERLAVTHWWVGIARGKLDFPVIMIQARQEENGYCTFYHDGLCELHDLGLKPTEGRLSHHSITKENYKFGKSLAWNVAKEWMDMRNGDIVEEIIRHMTS